MSSLLSGLQPHRVWRKDANRADNRFGLRAFAGGIAGFTAYAISLTLVLQQYAQHLGITKETKGVGGLVVGLIVGALIGVIMMVVSRKPLVSFAGLTLTAGCFGLILGIVTPGISFGPLVASLAIVVVLALIGWFVPADLHGWGSWLVGLTIGLIVMGFLVPGLHEFSAAADQPYVRSDWLDWLTVLLFSAWVIYDWNRSRRMARTLDNMIDSAGAIYLDWLNLYLAISGIDD